MSKSFALVVAGICDNVIVADAAPDDGRQWVNVTGERCGRGDRYDAEAGTFYRDTPEAVDPPPEAIISVREFTDIIGASAMGAIRERAKTDDDYGTLWDLGKMTGDVDRSSDAMPAVLDDLLAGGHITQAQYDEAYPEAFRQ